MEKDTTRISITISKALHEMIWQDAVRQRRPTAVTAAQRLEQWYAINALEALKEAIQK